MTAPTRVTAAVLLIGDELLSGRTRDANLQAIARHVAPLGVQVAEARTVSDRREAIVAAVNALRAAYDYVFTTGGIGPTHDDITVDAIAAAFGVGVSERADALAILEAAYGGRSEALTPARRRMARIPDGASLIANPATAAPGFQIENVFVLAGVPGIMRAMLEDVDHRIAGGAVMHAAELRAPGLREGEVAEALGALQARLGEGVSLGSYPFFRSLEDYGVCLVARGLDAAAVEAAAQDLAEIARTSGAAPEAV